ERAAWRLDNVALDELDEVGRLVLVQLGARDEPEADGRGRDALLEIEAVEGEAVAEELDDVVVAGVVVAGRFHARSVPWPRADTPLFHGACSRVGARRRHGLGAVVAVRESRLPRARDRRRRRRRSRSRAPLGEDRAPLLAGVAASAARA